MHKIHLNICIIYLPCHHLNAKFKFYTNQCSIESFACATMVVLQTFNLGILRQVLQTQRCFLPVTKLFFPMIKSHKKSREIFACGWSGNGKITLSGEQDLSSHSSPTQNQVVTCINVPINGCVFTP